MSEHAADHPLIKDVIALYRRHLAPKEADGWLGWAATQAIGDAVQLTRRADYWSRRQREYEREIVETLWDRLWQALALADPGLFLFPPSRLGPADRGTPLAFLYLQRQRPLRELRLRRPEQEALGRARRAAYRWTGLGGLRRPARFYVVRRQDPLIWWRLEFFDTAATALCEHRRLRDVVLVSEREIERQRAQRPYRPIPLAALLLHESVHGAVGAAANIHCDRHHVDLARPVHEGFAAIVEAAAVELELSGAEPTAASVARSLDTTQYPRQARALLRLFPAREPISSFGPPLAQAVIAVERAATAEEAVLPLNALAGWTRSPRQWRLAPGQ